MLHEPLTFLSSRQVQFGDLGKLDLLDAEQEINICWLHFAKLNELA